MHRRPHAAVVKSTKCGPSAHRYCPGGNRRDAQLVHLAGTRERVTHPREQVIHQRAVSDRKFGGRAVTAGTPRKRCRSGRCWWGGARTGAPRRPGGYARGKPDPGQVVGHTSSGQRCRGGNRAKRKPAHVAPSASASGATTGTSCAASQGKRVLLQDRGVISVPAGGWRWRRGLFDADLIRGSRGVEREQR